MANIRKADFIYQLIVATVLFAPKGSSFVGMMVVSIVRVQCSEDAVRIEWRCYIISVRS
ncbi:predicted protein [Sclerotinia sclerotiorum 1980 UF-70]|uniref:Uncharacterized protein n=1 Tax=Sclerotinia sclerotiorum (strain ATCC 18683 / 1980 / Ss-1) TaxID=665079 RepID=A7EN07_SCLS1|nr:predicted protein [Sclerotinia sclerotiorum 1980 UF-70]EDO04223.1 predicted protein [Sclerotinia sclerotiorum 1980 UF-70]